MGDMASTHLQEQYLSILNQTSGFESEHNQSHNGIHPYRHFTNHTGVSMQKVYDCFAFFNELDLLEIRLNILNDVVDFFVLVEATRTFQKQPKPLFFDENKDRFKKFEDKIIHVVVDTYPNFFTRFRVPKPMDYDNHQKNQIVRGLTHAQPDDIIIYSDLDEIPSPEKITKYRNKPGIKVFEQRFYSYYANCALVEHPSLPKSPNNDGQARWHGSVMAYYRDFSDTKSFRKMRDRSEPEVTIIEDGGWHFTYLGGIDSVIYKLNSFAHAREKKYGIQQTLKVNSVDALNEMINQGKDILGRDMSYKFVTPDDTLPKYLVENQNLYLNLFHYVDKANN